MMAEFGQGDGEGPFKLYVITAFGFADWYIIKVVLMILDKGVILRSNH